MLDKKTRFTMLFRPVYMSVRPNYLPPQRSPLAVDPPRPQKQKTPEKSRSPSPIRPLIKYVELEPEVLTEPPSPPPEEPTERLPLLISGYKFQKVIPQEASRDVLTGKVPYIYFDENGMQIFKPKHVFNALKLKRSERRKFVDYPCVGGHERDPDFPVRHPVIPEYEDYDYDEEVTPSWMDSYPIMECLYRLHPFIY